MASRSSKGVLSAGHSHLDAQAEMNGFSNPQWKFRYRGWVDLLDFRETLREPMVQPGASTCAGKASSPAASSKVTGIIPARISRYLRDFSRNRANQPWQLSNRQRRVEFLTFLQELSVAGDRASDNAIRRAEIPGRHPCAGCEARGSSAAIEHRNFPIDELHWDARITADTVKRGAAPSNTSKSLRIPCGRLPNNWRNIINL